MDELGTGKTECRRKVAIGRKVADAVRSLVNFRDLDEALLVYVFMYGSEKVLRKIKKRSRIMVVQTYNLRGLLAIRRMDRVPNTRISELCGVTKGVDERIDEGVLRWLNHVERMENDGIGKRVYVGECAGSCLVCCPRKSGLKP